MSDLHITEQQAEKAILVGGIFPYSIKEKEPLTEIAHLAKTAGAKVIGSLIQRKAKPEHSTFFGKGKIQELKEKIEELNPDIIICDNELSPSQSRNLEKILEKRIVDRSELIIDIFVKHASTRQAQLQVQLAQMKYLRSRLKRMWTHLSRIQGGIGMKGPGETQLETDKRIIKKKIHEIQEKLTEITERKEREISTRNENFTVAIVGYTNAGKSTLLQALTGLETYIEDKLFATLDTTTRKVKLDKGVDIFLTDTVGFVRDLPTHLVASFKATLMEAQFADLLLHVVDLDSENPVNQINAVDIVLSDLGIHNTQQLIVFNKIDNHQDSPLVADLKEQYPNGIFISAKKNIGLEQLKAEIVKVVTSTRYSETIKVHIGDGKTLYLLDTKAHVSEKKYEGDYVFCTVEGEKGVIDQIKSLHSQFINENV